MFRGHNLTGRQPTQYIPPSYYQPHTIHGETSCWCGYKGKPKKKVPRKETRYMSNALWCDMGDHAFSANDPNKRKFSQTEEVPDPRYEGETKEVTTVMDVCGACFSVRNPFQNPASKAETQADIPVKGTVVE